jgi:hypothetical protein
MPARRFAWADLPVLVAGLLLFTGGVLLMAQVTMGALWHGKQMKLCAAVFGVTQPDMTELTLGNLLSGAYQESLARRIGARQPYFPLAVRLRDQMEYSLFHISAMPSVIVGRGLQLNEVEYVNEYCSRNLQNFETAAPAWAASLRRMQDLLRAQGKTFLYVITPSKVAMYPDSLPAGMRCPSPIDDRIGYLPYWSALLQKDGINTVNTAAILANADGDYGTAFFPRGGFHWNALASTIAAQAIEAWLNAQRQDGMFEPLTFTWRLSPHPGISDLDLGFLMNLIWLPDHFETPVVSIKQATPGKQCHAVRVVIIAGSFMERIGPILSQLPCRPRVVQYFYWHGRRDVWLNGVLAARPVDPATRDADLQAANVIIYEENEELLSRSAHGQAFYEWLLTHPAR